MQNKSLDRLYIGNRSAGLTRAFIQFATMPTIPEGSTITSATMTLHLTSGTSTAANASAYMVTGGEWASGTIQWSNMPAANVLLQGDISHNNVTGYTFSCLTAVQAWYNGDPTGQHNNYGIMLKYANESVDDYNAVYSADYTDANKRPSLSIIYQTTTSTVDVLVGNTSTLTVSGYTGTITWSSDNTTVATVSSSGVVTALQAGKAVVTAYAGTDVLKTFAIYVKIQDGVYYIKSGDSVCLGTSGQVAEGTDTSLQTLATSGRAQLNQLWRITYLSNGYYSIRPLYKPDMGLCSKNGAPGAVEITGIGMTDTLSGVPGMNRWTIEKNGDGYSLYCAGTSNMTMRFSTPYPGASVVTQSYTASLSGFVWELEKTTSVTTQVLLLDTETGVSAEGVTKYIEPGETVTLADLGLAAYFVCAYDADQAITWEPLKPSVAAVDSETGEITPMTAGGTTTITAKHNYNGTNYGASFAAYVKPVPNGTYSIRSRAYNRYVQINSYDASNGFLTSGASIEQWAYHGENYQKWSVTWRGNGYYSIISAQSGMALSVVSGQTGNTGVSLVQETYTGADRQLWEITATSQGRYKIKAKSAEGLSNDLVMTAGHGTPNDSNGVAIEQYQYTDDEIYNDEWFVTPIVDIGMSTDNYTAAPNDMERQSYTYATSFYTGLTYPVGVAPFTLTHKYNMASTNTATKNDFAINGAISNEIDFMIYIGHGHVAHIPEDPLAPDLPWGNHAQYSYSVDGEEDLSVVCNTKDDLAEIAKYCLYTSEARFGANESDLRWVWMYTCNFLNTAEDISNNDGDITNNNGYVTNADLMKMMTGAHLVMGHASKATLCTSMANNFATYISNGEPLFDAFFKAGHTGEASEASENHFQKILLIPQARYETIYSPAVHYEYDLSDVSVFKRCIQDAY